MAKFSASDLASSTIGLSNATTKFSDMLSIISRMQAVGETFVSDLEEWIDVARDDNGDPNYSTDSLKTSIDTYTKYFDGKRSTPVANSKDLVHAIYDTATSFISVAWADTTGDERIGNWSPDAKFD